MSAVFLSCLASNAVEFEVFAKQGEAGMCFGHGTSCLWSRAPCHSLARGRGLESCRSRLPQEFTSGSPRRPKNTLLLQRHPVRCRGDGATGGGGRRKRSEHHDAAGPKLPFPAAIPNYVSASGVVDHSDIIRRIPVMSAPGAVRDISA